MEISLAVAIYWLLQMINGCLQTQANPEARRLYDDLFTNYNRLIRPVGNNSDTLTVKMGLQLSQLIEVVSIKNYLKSPSDLKKDKKTQSFFCNLRLYIPSKYRCWFPHTTKSQKNKKFLRYFWFLRNLRRIKTFFTITVFVQPRHITANHNFFAISDFNAISKSFDEYKSSLTIIAFCSTT